MLYPHQIGVDLQGRPVQISKGFFSREKMGVQAGGSPLVRVWGRSPQKNLKIAFLKPSEKFDF